MTNGPWWARGLPLVGIGWFIAIAIVLGALGGVWLDRRLDVAPLFLLMGLALGIVVAFYGAYRMVMTFLVDTQAASDEEKRD